MKKESQRILSITIKSALAKVFRAPTTDFIKTPERTRASIARSRYDAIRDKDLSAKTEQKYARFTSAFGLRRAEMEQIRAEDLFIEDGNTISMLQKGQRAVALVSLK